MDVDAPNQNAPDLTEIANYLHTDKGTAIGDWGTGHGYTRVYESLLKDKREQPLNVLEIGVWKGASLRMWEQYLSKARIVGVDILPETAQAASKQSQVVIGDASDPDFLRRLALEYFDGPIDFIIDDGSHALDHQITAVETLFPFLAPGGVFVVEDTSVSRFALKIVNTASFADFNDYAARLAEQTTFLPDAPLDAYNTIRNIGGIDKHKLAALHPSYWNKALDSVCFHYNMCVLHKGERKLPDLLDRVSVPPVRVAPGSEYVRRQLQAELDSGAGGLDSDRAALGPLDDAIDAVTAMTVRVEVASQLAKHDGSAAGALSETVADLGSSLSDYGALVKQARRDALRIARELQQSRVNYDLAMRKLTKAEAEVEFLRDKVFRYDQEFGSPDPGGDVILVPAPSTVEASLEAEQERSAPRPQGGHGRRIQWLEEDATRKEELSDDLLKRSEAAERRLQWLEQEAGLRGELTGALLKRAEAAERRIEWLDEAFARETEAHSEGRKEKEAGDRRVEWLESEIARYNEWALNERNRADENGAERERAKSAVERLSGELESEKTALSDAAERIDYLESEVVRGAAELAQIRLIHVGLLDTQRKLAVEAARAKVEADSERVILRQEREQREALQAERDHLLHHLEITASEMSRRSSELEALNAEHHLQVVQVSNLSAYNDQLRSYLEQLAHERDDAGGARDRLQSEIEKMGRQLDEAQSHLAAVLKSTSWRVTGALRWVRTMGRSV